MPLSVDVHELREQALEAASKELRRIRDKQERGTALTRTDQNVLTRMARLLCEEASAEKARELAALAALDPSKWTDEHLRKVLKAAGREDLAKGISGRRAS